MRIAFFTPLSPVRSGISTYSEQLLAHLHGQAEIDLYVDGFEPSHPVIGRNFPILDCSAFPENGRGYDLVIYQMGNYTPYHEAMYREMIRTPGIVVLHDSIYFHFYQGLTLGRGDEDGFREIMRYCYGKAGLREIPRALSDEIRTFRYPMTGKILDSAIAAVVHSEQAAGQLQSDRPDATVHVIPMGVTRTFPPGRSELTDLRRHHGIAEDDFVVASFGNTTPYKRIDVALRAFARFCKHHPKARYLIVGNLSSQYSLRDLITELGIEDRVIITGHVDERAFQSYKYLCDLCIGLRYPTAGETSLSILELMEAGKAVAVSNYAQFGELPDDCVLKIDFHPGEADILAESMLLMARDPDLRRSIGQNARKHVHQWHSIEAAAHAYVGMMKAYAGNSNGSSLEGILSDTGRRLAGLAGETLRQPLQDQAQTVLDELGIVPNGNGNGRHRSLQQTQLSQARYAARKVHHHYRSFGLLSAIRLLKDKAAARLRLPGISVEQRYIPQTGLKCQELFEEVCILPDGRAVCSCCDGLAFDVLGDTSQETVYETFNNFHYQNRRHSLLANTPPQQCIACGLRTHPLEKEDQLEMPVIRKLQIEVFNACNLKCPECVMSTHQRQGQSTRIMSLETFQGIIDQLKGPLEMVKFYNYGEPFLHRDCMKMLRYIKESDPEITIHISSNGLLIDSERQKELVELGVDHLLLSVDGTHQESYGKYRVGGSFETVLENMRGLVQARTAQSARRPQIYWQYILFDWNDSDEEIRRAKELACEVGVDALVWILTHTAGASKRFVPGSPLLETLTTRDGLPTGSTRFVFNSSDGPIAEEELPVTSGSPGYGRVRKSRKLRQGKQKA